MSEVSSSRIIKIVSILNCFRYQSIRLLKNKISKCVFIISSLSICVDKYLGVSDMLKRVMQAESEIIQKEES